MTTASRGHNVVAPGLEAAERRFTAEVVAEAEAAGERLGAVEVERRARARRALFYARLSYASTKARAARSRRPTRVSETPRIGPGGPSDGADDPAGA